MLCEICKKNPATIHIQELNKDKTTSLHICTSCSAKKGLDLVDLQGVNIAEILYKLSASAKDLLPAKEDNTSQLKFSKSNEVVTNIICPNCKWEIIKFQKTGKLGCETCYQAFSGVLSETICNIHKGIIHIGKSPERHEANSSLHMLEIFNLQKQLDLHVVREEYEEAAKLRDKINEIKKENNID